MKKFFLALLLCFWSINAYGAIAVVQSISCSANGVASCTTGNLTTTTTNLFICDASYWSGSGTTATITDSKSNTYSVSVAEILNFNSSQFRAQQRYKENGTGGSSHNFTITQTDSGAYSSLACKEVSGAITSGALDKTASKNDNNVTTGITSTSTATIAQADELLAGFGTIILSAGTATFTAQSSFTANQNISYVSGGNMGLISASRVVSSAATYAFTYDSSVAPDASSGVAAISTWKASVAAAAAIRHKVTSQ